MPGCQLTHRPLGAAASTQRGGVKNQFLLCKNGHHRRRLRFPLAHAVHASAAAQRGGMREQLCRLLVGGGGCSFWRRRRKVQRGGVDAVAETGGLGSVLEHVAKMAAAQLAAHFRSYEAGVRHNPQQVASN